MIIARCDDGYARTGGRLTLFAATGVQVPAWLPTGDRFQPFTDALALQGYCTIDTYRTVSRAAPAGDRGCYALQSAAKQLQWIV